MDFLVTQEKRSKSETHQIGSPEIPNHSSRDQRLHDGVAFRVTDRYLASTL